MTNYLKTYIIKKINLIQVSIIAIDTTWVYRDHLIFQHSLFRLLILFSEREKILSGVGTISKLVDQNSSNFKQNKEMR